MNVVERFKAYFFLLVFLYPILFLAFYSLDIDFFLTWKPLFFIVHGTGPD